MNPAHRIYSDYFLPSRLGEYDSILLTALEKGYEHMTLTDFRSVVSSGSSGSYSGIFLHRHDIDTDVSTAGLIFNTEKKRGIRSSYYFRLSTLDFELMKEIHDYGSEVGYHYEEIATFCKRNGIKDVETVKSRMGEIRDAFLENLAFVEKGCGFKIRSIASHGDFVNRKLGMPNHALVDAVFLSETGVGLECYDPLLVREYSVIISDAPYPHFYRPLDPFTAISESRKVIYMLTHPRHWRSSVLVNLKDDILRAWEGFKYRMS
ncbi:MAG: hypothetical protein RL213_2223 [Bacteroidota bacterium]